MKTSSRLKPLHLLVAILVVLVFWGCEEVKLEPLDVHGSYTIGFHLDDSAEVYI
ncbi:MAG: hypothetical protein H8E26_03955, partial [FCB group bacterium]|nr:hypothetical protein [FCB group bacterium]